MTIASKVTKIETIRQMLHSPEGATLGQICAATGWQVHSARAALSGLRKSGHCLVRDQADGSAGEAVYRITTTRDAEGRKT